MLINAAIFSGLYIAAYIFLGGLSVGAPALLVLVFGAILVWITVEDIAFLSIPAPILVAATFLGLALADDLGEPLWRNIGSAILYGGAAYGLGWLFTRATERKGVGLGDCWLIAIGAIVLGPVLPIKVVLIATLGALLWLPVRGFFYGLPATAPLPLSPFIAAGIWCTLIQPALLF